MEGDSRFYLVGGGREGFFFQDRINCPFFLMFFTMRRDDGWVEECYEVDFCFGYHP